MKKVTKQSRQQTKQERKAWLKMQGRPEFKLSRLEAYSRICKLRHYKELRSLGKTPEYQNRPVVNGVNFY